MTDPAVCLEDADLRDYAELSCCVRNHRSKVIDEYLMEQLVRRWRNELTRQRNDLITATSNFAQPSARTLPNADSPQRFTINQTRGRGDRHDPILLHFEPYEIHMPVSMSDLIAEPLTELHKKPGSLYCASRSSDPGYHNAGCTTTRSVTQRIQKLQKCSGYHNAVTLDFSVRTNNAHRAESLLHAELKEYRREEQYCLDASCNRRHREWFEIDVERIKRAMILWAQWLNEAIPYDENSRLQRPWKEYCQRLQREGTPITSLKLYLAFSQRLVRGEDEDDNSTSDDSTDEDGSTDEDSACPSTEHNHAEEENLDGNECPICLSAMNGPDGRARTICGHEFHAECIANWFEASNRCPMCRTEIVDGEVAAFEEAEIPMRNTAVD